MRARRHRRVDLADLGVGAAERIGEVLAHEDLAARLHGKRLRLDDDGVAVAAAATAGAAGATRAAAAAGSAGAATATGPARSATTGSTGAATPAAIGAA